jgi:hypothetical protein
MPLVYDEPKGGKLEYEKGNLYTQGAEDIVYSPEGIPLTTSSYGSENPYQKTQQALTAATALPLNIATGAAKIPAGVVQTFNKYFGGDGVSPKTLSDLVTGNQPARQPQGVGDNMVNAINQIEAGTQAQAGDIGKRVLQGGSIVGEVAPYVMSPMKGGAPTMMENLGAKAAPYIDKAIGALPSYLQKVVPNVTKGVGLGAVSGVATPEEVGLSPEEFRAAKNQNIGIQAALGGGAPILSEGASLMGSLLRKGLGMATGAGEESIAQAYKAGKEGGEDFMKNLQGDVSATEVLAKAKQALSNMRATRMDEYRTGIESTKNMPIFYKFDPIEKELTKQLDTLTVKNLGKEASLIGDTERAKVGELQNVIKEWKKSPELWTAEGLDALKRRLDAIYPENLPQAGRVIQNVRDKVYNHIVELDPKYAKTMANYEQAIKLEREIERALSLGKDKAADTAIRKLQSVTRNNAQTNFGYRKELIDALRNQGGIDLMPSLAGQSLSSWTPRGIVGQGADVAALGGALYNIANGDAEGVLGSIPLMALTSPKLMGLGAYGAGKLSNKALNPEQIKAMKVLLMQQSAKANQGASNE